MLAQSFEITDKEFELFRGMIYRETGIDLSERKKRLVIARLSKRLRALNLESFTDYYNYLQNDRHADSELVLLINRITTNKTDYFREMHHFDYLKHELLPQIISAGEKGASRTLRIWSAGCSTGEEPYSLAMTVADTFAKTRGWDIKILATDLDTDVLSKASQGLYNSMAVSPVPSDYMSKFFRRSGSDYEVVSELKNMIYFRKLNLMNPFPMKKQFDIIFCRNVIIYFDAQTKHELMTKFHQQLKNQGHMFIGHSESLMHMKDKFRYIKNTIYQKV